MVYDSHISMTEFSSEIWITFGYGKKISKVIFPPTPNFVLLLLASVFDRISAICDIMVKTGYTLNSIQTVVVLAIFGPNFFLTVQNPEASLRVIAEIWTIISIPGFSATHN